MIIYPDSNFMMIGERTNVTGSRRFARLIKTGDYAAALAVAREQVAGGREYDRRQHGRGVARFQRSNDRVFAL